jgi:hypothetical protein
VPDGGLRCLEDFQEVLELPLRPVAEAAKPGVDIIARDHHRRRDQEARAGRP